MVLAFRSLINRHYLPPKRAHFADTCLECTTLLSAWRQDASSTIAQTKSTRLFSSVPLPARQSVSRSPVQSQFSSIAQLDAHIFFIYFHALFPYHNISPFFASVVAHNKECACLEISATGTHTQNFGRWWGKTKLKKWVFLPNLFYILFVFPVLVACVCLIKPATPEFWVLNPIQTEYTSPEDYYCAQ